MTQHGTQAARDLAAAGPAVSTAAASSGQDGTPVDGSDEALSRTADGLAATTATTASAGLALSAGQFRAASAAVLMTMLLGALDQTIVSVAVPTIAHQIGGIEWMAWVISAYLIASTVVTPLYGKVSDIVGRPKVMTAAILIFLVASAGCALARTMPQLVLARVLQGVGGGGLIAMAQSVVADIVPLRDRGRYQGYISIVWVLASLLGPVVGGVLTEYLSWPWIFWINLPVGMAALVLVRRALSPLPVIRRDARVDAVGALLLLTGLTAFLIPITRVGQGVSWADPANLLGWLFALVLLTVFALQQRRHADPIVPFALLGDRVVVAACAILFIGWFYFIALTVLVPLRLQVVAGYSPGDAGLHLLPLTLAVPVAAFLAGRWLHRTGGVLPAQRLGCVLVPTGLAALGFAGPSGPVVVAALVVVGIGQGLQAPTTLIIVQHSVEQRFIGIVTSLTAFFRLLGGAIGIAVLSSLVLLLLRAHLPAGVSLLGEGVAPGPVRLAPGDAGARDAAFRYVMWVSAAIAMVPIWLSFRLPDVRSHEKPPLGGE